MIYKSVSNKNGSFLRKDCGLLLSGFVSEEFSRDFHHQSACVSTTIIFMVLVNLEGFNVSFYHHYSIMAG